MDSVHKTRNRILDDHDLCCVSDNSPDTSISRFIFMLYTYKTDILDQICATQGIVISVISVYPSIHPFVHQLRIVCQVH